MRILRVTSLRLRNHSEFLAQTPYRCRFDWGLDGARRAEERGDVLVVVDTLRFSTATAAAVEAGVSVYPCSPDEDVEAYARMLGGNDPFRSDDRWAALSPLAYRGARRGDLAVVPSPNGAMCTLIGSAAPALFAGALVNARATAEAVMSVLGERSVTVIACGERMHETAGEENLRFAIEDLLGAGAIIVALEVSKSPEAVVAQAAFEGIQESLAAALWESVSGRELLSKGHGDDVKLAAALDQVHSAAQLRGDHFEGV